MNKMQDPLVVHLTEITRRDAAKRRENAAYSGFWSDGGAAEIEDRLTAWLDGVQYATTGTTEIYGFSLENFKARQDPEYTEWVRLNAKFGKGTK